MSHTPFSRISRIFAHPPAGWLLGLTIALFVALAAAYAATIPVLEGFDAQAHNAAVAYYRADRTFPVLSEATVKRSYELITQPPLYYVTSALLGVGWPTAAAEDTARASVNAYFDKSLSHRQSITLPAAAFATLAPAWIARLTALLGGLGVLLCTWWLARLLSPRSTTFAMAAAVVAVLNPQFLSTAITISNDAWAAATCALALAAGTDVVLRRRRPQAWFWVGVAVAVAALTKYSGLLIALPVGILFLFYLRQRGWRKSAAALGFAALGFILVGGWWFVRNWLLYGELVPFNQMAAVLPSMRRAQPYTLERTLEHIPWLVASFWGVFVSVIAPALYLDITRWFMVLGFAGLALAALLWPRRREYSQLVLLVVLLPWLAAVAVSVLNWTRTVNYGEQGRLAHIGASAFGVAMAAGWQAFAPVRWRPLVHWTITVFMVVISLALLPMLQQNFGLPPGLAQPPTPDRPIAAHFDGGMRLLGIDLPEGAAIEPGQPLPITLYFTTDQVIDADYTLFLHIADDQDQLLYQFDGVPADGRHPTRQWLPGQIFADTHLIQVDAIPTDGLATLSLGFYPIEDPTQRQLVTDTAGQPLGDRLVLAKIRLHKTSAPTAQASASTAHASAPTTQASPSNSPASGPANAQPGAPLAAWSNGINLATATVAYDTAGLPASVTLTWTPTQTIQQDYTIFVQVLDAGDNILAQVDRQPQDGAYPTSTWRAGDIITDTLTWTNTPAWTNTSSDSNGATPWQRIVLGLYDTAGQRLPLTTPATPSNAVDLLTR